jgi:hypothetical protein
VTEPQKRIAELKHHHEVRLNEILDILQTGAQTAYGVASKMTWDIRCESWESFPVQQQWFATGEAISHLLHLGKRGLVTQEERDGILIWALNK